MKTKRIFSAKRPTATSLSSAEIAELDREMNERALFSARTNEQRYVAAIQGIIEMFIDGKIGESAARKEMQSLLEDFGYTPEGGFPDVDEPVTGAAPGSIEDLSSYARINLIVQTNASMAASVSRIMEETPETLDVFPAYRLIRFMTPNTKPRDWVVRWAAAGEAVGWKGAVKDEFVARKDSPIWQAIGDGAGGFADTLHNPYPPFAFNSGMGWEDVDRDEAVSLGLDLSTPVEVSKPSFAVKEDELDKMAEAYGRDFVDSVMYSPHDF